MPIIHCALACEARPFIDFYKLKQIHSKPFAVYSNDEIVLVVSGIGRELAAAALGFCYGLEIAPNNVWVNVGVAGARNADIGKAFIVHKAFDAYRTSVFYPPQIVSLDVEKANLMTVDQPEVQYHDAQLYDMEATAFFKVATMFSSSELVQSIKVVSDNTLADQKKLDTSLVTDLMQPHVSLVDVLLKSLQPLSIMLQETQSINPMYEDIIERYRFSVTQKNVLKGLLLRLYALDDQAAVERLISDGVDGKAVLAALKNHADQLDFNI